MYLDTFRCIGLLMSLCARCSLLWRWSTMELRRWRQGDVAVLRQHAIRMKILSNLCRCRWRRHLRASFPLMEASLWSSCIFPTLEVFSPGESLDLACWISNGGVFDVTSLWQTSFWRQHVIHMVLRATLVLSVPRAWASRVMCMS
jgi:hypothetical protein